VSLHARRQGAWRRDGFLGFVAQVRSMKTVYQFEVWDIAASDYKKSPRWGTSESIRRLKGRLVGIGVVVRDEAGEADGFTAPSFHPRQARGVGIAL
jgi:hypothetical protein